MKKVYLIKTVPPHKDISAERTWKPYKGKVLFITCQKSTEVEKRVAILSLNLDTKRRWVANPIPQPLYPTEKPWYPLYRRTVGLWGQHEQMQKILLPLGF